jgi:hypothetical protein
MKIIVPEEDKNMHLYLAYLGFNGPYAVCKQIAEWINKGECKDETLRFIDANKDNFEVMKYLNGLL